MADETNNELKSVPAPGNSPPGSADQGVIFSSHGRTHSTVNLGVNSSRSEETTRQIEANDGRKAAGARAATYIEGVLYDVTLSRPMPNPINPGDILPGGRAIQLDGGLITGDLAKAVLRSEVHRLIVVQPDPTGQDEDLNRAYRNHGAPIDPLAGLRERQAKAK
jgi:hypothetical protein